MSAPLQKGRPQGVPPGSPPLPQRGRAQSPSPAVDPNSPASIRRAWLRKTVSSMQWEMGMLGACIVYFVVVFVTFAADDQKIARLICGGFISAECKSQTLDHLDTTLSWIDVAFLTAFLVEICIKLLAQGISYLKDAFNFADFLIIVVSMIMTLIVLTTTIFSSAKGGLSLLPLFKVVRLLRVVLVITRVQRSAERYRRMKMIGLAAPVEKVFEIIGELRQKVVHQEDDKALAWTMDLIAKEELYKVSYTDSKYSTGMHLTQEMTDWLRSNLAQSLAPSLPSAISGGKSEEKKAQGRKLSLSASGMAAPDEANVAQKSRRHSARYTGAAVPSWITRSMSEANVVSILEKMEDWEFDVFSLHDATNGHPLVVGGMHLMNKMGVLDKIPIPRDKLANYLLAIERGYIAANPFHNALHASDVMFTTNYFLNSPLLRDMTGPLDKFAAVLAAAVHDYAHPGLSNPFLVATRAEEAIIYNDQSVLEMFHIAGAFRVLLSTPGCDITEGMARDQYRQFRETMVSMVLCTDMKVHFEHLGRLRTRVATDAYASVERKDVLLLLGQALHAADISNPTKVQKTMLRWTERVMKEFWQQGDRERNLGLPISAFMDRKDPLVPQCQLGFINVLVKPLYVEMRKLLGEIVQPAIDGLEASVKLWETEGTAAGNASAWDTEDFVR